MNCTGPCIAYVSGTGTPNDGHPVKVTMRDMEAEEMHGEPFWYVESSIPLMGYPDKGRWQGQFCCKGSIEDRYLRPISGDTVLDEAKEEVPA